MMDSNIVEDTSYNRSEEHLASQSSKALHALRPIELGDTGDKQESGKCHHFSIRGYVSEVRKTNRELCWPFHVIHNHFKLEEHADLLPPIIVTEFRWWHCKSCLSQAGIENGTAKDSHNLENRRLGVDGTSFNGNPVVEAHAHAPSSLLDFQGVPVETIPGEVSVEADSFINVKDGHIQPLLYSPEKDNESIDAGNHAIHFDLSEASQNLVSETTASGVISRESLRKEEADATEVRNAPVAVETHNNRGIISDHGTANISGSTADTSQMGPQTNKLGLQGKNAHNVRSTEAEETKLGFKVPEIELNSRILAPITNSSHVFGPEDVQGPKKREVLETKEVFQGVNFSVRRTNKCDIEGLERSNHKDDAKVNGDSVQSQDDNQSYPSQLDALNVTLHRKKARKIRMLNDIIKSEVLGLSRVGQTHLSNRNDAIHCRDESIVDPAASQDRKSAAECHLNVVSEEKEKEPFISEKRKLLPESEDEGPSLIHWLRRVPKKVKTQKCDEEHKPASNAIVTSKAVAYASSGKCLHSGIRICEAVQDNGDKSFEGEVPMNITHVEAVQPHVKLQHLMYDSNDAVVEGDIAKCINVGKVLPKLAINSHALCPNREQHDGSCKDIMMCRNQDKRYEVGNGGSSQVNGLEDSSGTFKCENNSVCKGSQQILKRNVRGKKGSAEEATDGLPVTREGAAVDSIQMREKLADHLVSKKMPAPPREKLSAAPVNKNMAASPLREKQAATPVMASSPHTEKKADSPVREKQAVLDGIPIEILELLQSNYHKNHQLNYGRPTARVSENHQLNSDHFTSRAVENHQLNYGCSTVKVIEPSEANKNVRDCTLSKLLSVTGSSPNTVPHSQHKNKSAVYSKSVDTESSAHAIGKPTGNSMQELRAQTYCSEKRRRQIRLKEGEGPAAFRESSFADLRSGLPVSGTQPPNTEPTGIYCPQNHSWNRVMLQSVEPHYNPLSISRQHPCRCFPHGAIQINNSHIVHPGIYNSSLFPQTTLLERNSSKVTQASGGIKLVDSNLGPSRRIKQKFDTKNKRTLSAGNVYVETGKESCSKVSQPLDLYTNDSIPAMHLLRLMDPAVGSSASPLCPTVSSDQADFLSKFKHRDKDYQEDFVGLDVGMRAKYPFNCLGISDHQIYSQTNCTNHTSPIPRYGAVDSSSHKRLLSGSNCFNAPYAFKGTNPSEVAFSLRTGEKDKRKCSHLTMQTKLSEQKRPWDRHSQDRVQLSSTGYPKLSEEREHVIHVEHRNEEEPKFPARSSCQTELCVVNRNPADFSIPDENNVYMISYEDLKPRYLSPRRKKQYLNPDTPRQQRILKLAASKWNLRC